LPLLIEDYSATEDVFTRAIPPLSLAFVGGGSWSSARSGC
jgi:hypothetical protein